MEFANPWDIGDFRDVLDRLKLDGFYVGEGCSSHRDCDLVSIQQRCQH
jgi:hypothetical protein